MFFSTIRHYPPIWSTHNSWCVFFWPRWAPADWLHPPKPLLLLLFLRTAQLCSSVSGPVRVPTPHLLQGNTRTNATQLRPTQCFSSPYPLPVFLLRPACPVYPACLSPWLSSGARTPCTFRSCAASRGSSGQSHRESAGLQAAMGRSL